MRSASAGPLDSEVSLADGPFWDECPASGRSYCPALSEPAHSCAVRRFGGTLLSQSRSNLEWRIRHVSGHPRACGRLADCARRVPVAHQCPVWLSRNIREQGEDLVSC